MVRKYTPGPWRIAVCKPKTNFYFISAKDLTANFPRELKITSIEGGEHPIKEYTEMLHANAKLIAAAPELLEALQDFLCIDWSKSQYAPIMMDVLVKKAESAIKKATG